MIFYGTYTKKLACEKINATCPTCGSSNLYFVAFQRIFHLTWIPAFPYKKDCTVACADCQSEFETDVFKKTLERDPVKVRAPLWSFSFLVVLVFMIFGLEYYEEKDREVALAFKKSPLVGTSFVYKDTTTELKKTPYTFAKIEKIEGGKYYVRLSKYSYSKKRRAEEAAEKASNNAENEDYFAKGLFEFSDQTFQDLDILNVYKKNTSTDT